MFLFYLNIGIFFRIYRIGTQKNYLLPSQSQDDGHDAHLKNQHLMLPQMLPFLLLKILPIHVLFCEISHIHNRDMSFFLKP